MSDELGRIFLRDTIAMPTTSAHCAVRSNDVLARFGGHEFVALLGGRIGRNYIERLAGRLHATFSEPVVVESVTLFIGASIGIVVIKDHDPRDAAEILRHADTAMYEAKTAGRGQSHYFTEELRDRTPRRHRAGDQNAPSAEPTQLARALSSRAVIDQAIGIIGSRAGGSTEGVFDGLLRIAESENVELAVIAHRLVEEAVNRRTQEPHYPS